MNHTYIHYMKSIYEDLKKIIGAKKVKITISFRKGFFNETIAKYIFLEKFNGETKKNIENKAESYLSDIYKNKIERIELKWDNNNLIITCIIKK